MNIVDVTRDWLKSLVPHGTHVAIDIAVLALKVGLDFGDGSTRLDADTRLELQAKLNQALLESGLLEVV